MRRRLRTARRDPLTGLRTREGFTRRATALLRDERAVVVLADVDHFKQINDRYGHAAGDTLLKATAQRLAHYVGPSGVAGRLGGDEFFSELPRVSRDQVRGRSVLRGRAGERLRPAKVLVSFPC
ncbi:GGDEF domain-containing protein [Streptomyces peucetius]|uniref:GGDEF domain-containing protein n=1 Tax=Streptomyces peucetius TaxID=1950 RepID=A0ABY6IHU4_STRPE|nr:GGDEF domain-containing protein [Streptomyces peucetius]